MGDCLAPQRIARARLRRPKIKAAKREINARTTSRASIRLRQFSGDAPNIGAASSTAYGHARFAKDVKPADLFRLVQMNAADLWLRPQLTSARASPCRTTSPSVYRRR